MDSCVVPHRSTNRAALWLTAQIGRDAVLSESYGRRHQFVLWTGHIIKFYKQTPNVKYKVRLTKVPISKQMSVIVLVGNRHNIRLKNQTSKEGLAFTVSTPIPNAAQNPKVGPQPPRPGWVRGLQEGGVCDWVMRE
jgi:hypothetical protein